MIISSLKGKRAFSAAYYFSFFFNLFCIYWVGMVTIPGMIAAVIIVAFYYALMWTIYNKVYHFNKLFGLLLLPFLWVGLEYFRTLSEFAFPWNDLGYTQAYYLYILQFVSITSVHGLTFLIVVVNILLWQILRKDLIIERRLTAFFVSIGIIMFLLGFGWASLPVYPEKGDTKLALLQGSVPLEVKWKDGNEAYSYTLYDSLSRSVEDSSISLYIWPETSAPTYLTHDFGARRRIGAIARATNAYHLVGALGAQLRDGKQRHFNSCYQFAPDGNLLMRYDKVKLVPFSEHVPYQDYLPFLEKGFLRNYLTFIETYDVQWWSDFYPGDSSKLFAFPEFNIPVLICFESTFPDFVRHTVLDGADFLIGTTNDTWFGESVGIYMHARIFLTRAVENRIWAARIANSGITYIVDGYGRIRSELEINDVTVLNGTVKKLEEYSFYTRHGDILGRISFLILISLSGILVLLWLLRKFINI